MYIPTYDIDEAYSYKHKGYFRNIRAIRKALFKGKFGKVSERIRVLRGEESDPFNSYEWMDNLHREYKLNPRYFFLVPGKLSNYDRNILPRKKALKSLLINHAKKYSMLAFILPGKPTITRMVFLKK